MRASFCRCVVLFLFLSGVACATRSPGASTAASAAPATSPASPGLRDSWLEMFARGYFPGRSGQVFVVQREGDMIVTGDPLYRFQHGSPWDYDAHIPLIFHGAPFVTPGSFQALARQQDVAPTIGAMIGAPHVASYTGRVLNEIVRMTQERPRVVSLIVLDAMRPDYFDRHAAALPTLARLRREGAWFANVRATSLPTVTGVGHASLGTGTEPRAHGIAVNNLFNRATGKMQEAYDRLDTRELLTLTLADVWNLATDGRAVIIGQGGAIRATAGPTADGRRMQSATPSQTC
jgi:hypothetical protein